MDTLFEKKGYTLGEACKDIIPVAQNSEKFMSFQIGKLKFIDSMLFLNSSLESLADNLIDKAHEDKYHKFTNMKNAFNDDLK
jgi:hypothetical protein